MPVDAIGNFTTANMAAGNYSVRIITTTPNYKVLDTNLSVIAGTANVLTAADSAAIHRNTGTDGIKDCV